VQVAHGSETRLRNTRVAEAAPHGDLVCDEVRRLAADPRQAECLGDRGDDRHGAVGSDREDTVHSVAATHLDDGLDVGEVDDLADVGVREPRRAWVAVDRDHVYAQLAHARDGAALVTACADEEDGGHGPRC
jgi:hypothetical protein